MTIPSTELVVCGYRLLNRGCQITPEAEYARQPSQIGDRSLAGG